MRTYCMANKLNAIVEVSDRFHLKPLLRAIAFLHAAYILALSENAVRLVELSADLPAREIAVPNMPTDAATAGGKATNKDYSGTGHRQGSLFSSSRLHTKCGRDWSSDVCSSDLGSLPRSHFSRWFRFPPHRSGVYRSCIPDDKSFRFGALRQSAGSTGH